VAADDLLHHDRARAESFGAVAANYDRFRPSYPDELIDDLVLGHPERALDIGCGTGKAARLLAARGVDVLGVEIDPQMAAVARAHGIEVEVARFEDWPDAGRRFPLIISAQAWHWVDPYVGGPKAARLLTPGGTFAALWNYGTLAPEVVALIDPIYERLAPEVNRMPNGYDTSQREALEASGAFASVASSSYPFDREWSVDEWLGNAATHSNHLLLGPDRLAAVLDALRGALEGRVDAVRETGGTYLLRAEAPQSE
jgi:SAM-dependent methyltransferase